MTGLLMDNQKLMVLLVCLLACSISFGGLDNAEAARKSTFRYEEPNVDKWVSYCQARHPKKSLQSCCSRRNGSCGARCKKSTYPNTAYETKEECLEECQEVHNQCRGVAEVVTNLKVCKRRYKTVVDRNLCCEEQLANVAMRCSDNSLCKKSYNSCFKKFSKKQYRKIRNRVPNPQWMKTYCQNPENRQDVSQFECCGRMIKRCLASCNGYPDSPKAKSDCNDRCVQHFEICKSR